MKTGSLGAFLLQKDLTRGADYAPWSLAVADVPRKSALYRSSFKSFIKKSTKTKKATQSDLFHFWQGRSISIRMPNFFEIDPWFSVSG